MSQPKCVLRLRVLRRWWSLLALALVAPATMRADVQRELGGHHMVALPWAGGASYMQSTFDEEARRWKEAGWTFVVLHMDAYDGNYPGCLRAYYDACAKVGIKAAASWAWYWESGLGEDPHGWIAQIVRDTRNHPAQWKIDGVPVYGAFNLPWFTKEKLQKAGLWPVKIWAHCYYLAPGWSGRHWTNDPSIIRNTYDSLPWISGLCNFSGDMSASQIASLNDLLVQVGHEKGKLTMAGVTPFYGSGHVWDMGGYRGLETQWNHILNNPPNAVWWVTSNDWRELSYVSDIPVTPVWEHHWNRSDMPPLLDHSGYRKFAEPYVAAYKAGRKTPQFTQDRLFLAYQLHPKNVAPIAGSAEYIFGGRRWRAGLADRIFVAAHLTAPARLRINGQLSEVFPAGVAHFDIPLKVGPAPEVAIVRDGHTVKSGRGPLAITNSPLLGAWNYLAVEVSPGGPTVSVPPPAEDSDSSEPPSQPPSESTGDRGGFAASDLGGPSLPGSTSYDATTGKYRIKASGRDIWDQSDQFQFAHQLISGDAQATVRVDSIGRTHEWAKAGIMFRASLEPDSPHVSVFLSPGVGVSMQWRQQAGGSSITTYPIPAPAPCWVRLQRSGDTFRAWRSSDGKNWQLLQSVQVRLPASYYAGLAVCAHQDGAMTTAEFSQLTINGKAPAGSNTDETASSDAGGTASAGDGAHDSAGGGTLVARDLGSPAIAGSSSFDAGSKAFRLRGSGRDIWDQSDQFQFASQPISGDATWIVRVASVTHTHDWTKAGIMARASLAPDSAHVSVFLSPGVGVSMQWRYRSGDISYTTYPLPAAAPRWLKLVRHGNTFTAYDSTDGKEWRLVRSESVSLPSTLQTGIALTSHNPGALASASFTDLSVNGASVTTVETASSSR